MKTELCHDEWAQAQIAAIVEYFGLEIDDGRYSNVRSKGVPEV